MKRIGKASMATIALTASLTMLLAGCGNTTSTTSNNAGNSTNSSNTASNSSTNSANAAGSDNTASTNSTTSDSGAVKDGGTLTLAQTTKWEDQMIPLIDGSEYTFNIWGISFDTLLNIDKNLNYQPWLAKTYSWSADHKTLTMTLADANWSDGQPITSKDVLLDMNFLASKDYNTKLQGEYESLVDPVVGAQDIVSGKKTSFVDTGGFQIVDDKTFKINFTTADAAVLTSDIAGITPLPDHILGSIPFAKWRDASFDKLANVVSGPFIPTAANGQASVTYKANPNYFKGKPHLDGIVMKYVSADVAPSLLQSGQINGILNGLNAKDYVSLQSDSNVTTIKTPDMGFEYMGVFDNLPIFSDYRTREAILYAVNRSAIVQGVFKGLAQPMNGAIPSASWAAPSASDGMTDYSYDPAKAKQLLQDAGFKKGSDGYLVDPKTGKTAEFKLQYSSGQASVLTPIADEIQQDLKAVGIKVDLNQPIDFNTMIQDLLDAKKKTPPFDAWIAGWGLGSDPDPRGLWNSKDTYNFENFVDPKNDALIKATWADPASFTQAGRQAAFVKWDLYINKMVPLEFLYQRDDLYAFSSNVHIPSDDWAPSGGLGGNEPLNPATWWMS